MVKQFFLLILLIFFTHISWGQTVSISIDPNAWRSSQGYVGLGSIVNNVPFTVNVTNNPSSLSIRKVEWSIDDNGYIDNGTNQTYTPTFSTDGTHKLVSRVTFGDGSVIRTSSSFSYTVYTNVELRARPDGDITKICTGASQLFRAQLFDKNSQKYLNITLPGTSYQWKMQGETVPQLSNYNTSSTTANFKSVKNDVSIWVTYTQTSLLGINLDQQNINSTNISIANALQIDSWEWNDLCNTDGTFNVKLSGGFNNETANLVWNFGDNTAGSTSTASLSSGESKISHNYTSFKDYNVGLSISVTNSNCPLSQSQKFYIGKPNISISSDADISKSICASNSNITFTAETDATASEIQWYVNNNLASDNNALNYTTQFTTASSNSVYAMQKDGCKSKSNILSVNTVMPPTPSFSATLNSNCGSVSFDNKTTPLNENEYTWTANGNTISTSTNNFTYNFSADGNYAIILTAQKTGTLCKASSTSQTITIKGPNVQILPNIQSAICPLYPLDVKLSAQNITNDTHPKTYEVDWGDNSPVKTITYQQSLDLGTHQYQTAGKYTITVNLITSGSCKTIPNEYTVTVAESCPENILDRFGVSILHSCENKKTITLKSTDGIAFTSISSADNSDASITKIDDDNYQIVFNSTGYKSIKIQKGTNSIPVLVDIVDIKPMISTANANDVNSNVCNYESTTLSIIDENTNTSFDQSNLSAWKWTVDGETQTSGTTYSSFTKTFDPKSSDYSIGYQLTDIHNCSVSLDKNFTLTVSGPIVDFQLLSPQSESVKLITNTTSSYYQSCDASFQGSAEGVLLENSSAIKNWNWTSLNSDDVSIASPTSKETILNFTNNKTQSSPSIQLQAIGENGCKSKIITKTIGQYSFPVANYAIYSNAIHCGDADITKLNYKFANRSSSYGSSTYTWTWTDGTDQTVTQNKNDVSHQFANISSDKSFGYYVPTLIAEDQNGCKSATYAPAYNTSDPISDNNIIRVTRPTADFSYQVTNAESACLPKNIAITNNSKYSSSYQWDFGDGTSFPTTTNINGFSSYSYTTLSTTTPGVPTVYNITLKTSDGDGCSATSASQAITLNGLYAYLTSSNLGDYACQDSSKISFKLSTLSSSNDSSDYTYAWNLGDGTTVNNIQNIEHSYTTVGEIIPSVYVTGNIGGSVCQTTAYLLPNKSFIVYDMPKPAISIDQNRICVGDGTAISLTKNEMATDPSGNNYVYTYSWNPDIDSTEALNYIKIYPTVTTTYNYTADNGFCHSETPITIAVDQLPNVTFSTPIGICRPSATSTTFNVELENADQIDSWSMPNGDASWITEIETNKKYQITVPSDYATYMTPFNAIVSQSDGTCAPQTIATKFYVSKNPVFKNASLLLGDNNYINYLSPITAGQKVTVKPDFDLASPYETLSYAWSPADIFDKSDIANPTFTSNQDQDITLSVTNEFGCATTTVLPIVVNDIPQSNIYQRNVPNAFSPNGDGRNDYFYITGFGIKNVKSLAIFDRLGQQIFLATNKSPNDQLSGWNGNLANGQQAPVATYVYIAEIETNNGKILPLKGTVTLIR